MVGRLIYFYAKKAKCCRLMPFPHKNLNSRSENQKVSWIWHSDCKMTPCFISLWFSPSYNVTLQPLHGRSGICLPALGIWVGLGTCSGQQDVVEVTVSSSKPTIQGALRAPVSLIPPQPQAWLAGWRTRHRQKSVVRAPLLTAHTREPS